MALIPFGISLVLGLLIIPGVRWLGIRWGRVSLPRDDRWHRQPTPTFGGVGIFLAFALSLLLTDLLDGQGLEDVSWGALLGSGAVFLLGLYDDFKRISPPAKLIGQILAASLVVFMGYTTGFFTPRIPDNLVAQVPNILLTFIWLIGITNAINLLDNMDGLAGGIALITAGILSFFFWKVGNQGLLWISMALAGGIVSFLVFNFPPASIFMGDSGSLFLGFTLAFLAIARQPQASNVFAVLGVPTLLFLLPILDTTLVAFTRLLRGESPIKGGRDHTSHRLIAFGFTERQAVLVLYGVALVSGTLAAALESLQYWFSLVLVPILVVSLALLTAYLGGLKVVAPTASERLDRGLTRVMLELTFKRRLLEVILDFFLIAIAFYLAIFTRFGFSMNAARLELFLQALPLTLAGAYLALFGFGVYRGVWRYVGVNDFMRLVGAAMGATFLVATAVFFIYPEESYAAVIFLLFGIYLFLLLAASRSSFRIMDLAAGRPNHAPEERVLIYGAGDSGEMALRWILMNPQLAYRPVGFLDDNPFLAGRQIHGVAVLGRLDQLSTILQHKRIEGVIIAAPDELNSEVKEKLLAACRARGCWIRCLRLEFEVLAL